MTRHVLDLFCGLGGFSAAFADAEDWSVTTVDIEERFDPDIQADVMDLRPSDLPDADVVLASPPCTRFGKAACWHEHFDAGGNPQTEGAREHVSLIYHTIGIIRALTPRYWFLENPQGKLPKIIGRPAGTVTYCQYGRNYQKRTHLWGNHPPIEYRSCVEGDNCHTNTPRSDERHPNDNGWSDNRDERAKVPYDLSEAIREAVDAAYAGETYEQATLPGISQ
jgi:hypothetical protein